MLLFLRQVKGEAEKSFFPENGKKRGGGDKKKDIE